ncbi:acyltransferase [Gorillibacterium sp. CAU 1737]|uniref:acyltransferase family protein n=1 Tax=Gorillibacterium sp. CAU 1737 TaxID=3140362 RepID=UPI0032602BE0
MGASSSIFEEKIPSHRENNLNLLRFLAALMVIIGHMYHILGLPVLTLGGQAVSTIGVEIFFLISGYLITESFMRDSNIIRYGLRRFFRIIPGLTALILITVFVMGPLVTTLGVKEYLLNSNTLFYLRNIILFPVYSLPGVFADNLYPNAVNGSLWTLIVEVLMYILLPVVLFLGSLLKRRKLIIVLFTLALVVTRVVLMEFYPTLRIIFYGTSLFDVFTLAPYFFVGVLFTFPEVKKILNIQIASILLLSLFVIQISYVKTEMLMLLVLSYFVFSFAFSPKPAFRKWFFKNDYSYGMYLYAFPVQQLLASNHASFQFTFNVYLMLTIGITFVCAYLSWHVVEKPAQVLGKWINKSQWIPNTKLLFAKGD